MKRTKLILLAGVALTLAACTTTDEPFQALDAPVAAVVVGDIGDGQSRAADVSWDSGDQIGISTISTGKTMYANMQYQTSGTGKFEHVGGKESGIFFQDTDEVHFYAYYPFTGMEGTFVEIIRDVSTADQSRQKQFDYLISRRASATHVSPSVNFLFTHMMTRIVLNISADSNSDLTSSDVQQGSYFLSGIRLVGDFNTVTGSAVASGNVTDNWAINATPTDKDNVHTYSLIVFPQTISKLTFSAIINGKTYSGVFKNLSLVAGTSCAFNISIRETDLVIGSCTITDRINGGLGGGTATIDRFVGHKAVLMREGTADQPPLYIADRNIGANAPEDVGLYFWWGDIEGHTSDFKFDKSNPAIVTYGKTIIELKAAGFIDDNNNLTPHMDAAQQHWGGSWRMPTDEDIQWLKDNCTTKWQDRGCNMQSNTTGETVYLPAAGRYDGEDCFQFGNFGYYWLSTAHDRDPDFAYAKYLNLPNIIVMGESWAGMSVRPVSN